MIPKIYSINGGKGKLLAVSTDRFKSELLTLQFAVPLQKETAQRYTLLLELLCRGTEQYPSRALFSRRLDDLYATAVAPYSRRIGDMQILGFTTEFLGARYVGGGNGILQDVIQMLSQLLLRPYLPGGVFHLPYLESEKNHLRDAIRARINHPRAYARGKCRTLLFEGEPCAFLQLGEEETVDAITAADLTLLWQDMVQNLSPTFFYVGNTPGEELAQLLETSFTMNGGFSHPYHTLVRQYIGDPVKAEEEMPLCQSKLAIGFRTDVTLSHPLAPATAVLNDVLGGSPASKLFLNVREKRSLCYHCSSTYDIYKGAIFAEAGISSQNRAETEQAIRTEFDALARGEISSVEWNAAKQLYEFLYKQVFDHPSSVCSFYMGRDLIGFEQTLEQYRKAIAAVTREDVVEAATHLREGAEFFLQGALNGEEDEEE